MARSFLRNALNHLIDDQKREAARYLQGALLKLDDGALKNLGVTRQEIRHTSASRFGL